ncbi:hypothetical protein [Pigmentiphaga kullae]|uniref:Uncharacterized protein n=1 Tax=Pigmentiphaga kullae TaxID=151784 RepID=A0A4V2F2Z5_9BURK|nr:hypothetical protein [Pigmentiphaga kullae]RZS80614.1 hypothetical protein EV675_3226 [Pigmentiphaga kullae]
MRDEIPVTPEEEAAWREMEQRQAQQATQHQASGPAGAPDRIFLVIGEDVTPDTPFSQLAEVTWCPDRVNDTDIEYVRAQPAAATPDEIEGLRAHVALLKTALAQAERENDELRAQPAAATVTTDAQAIRDAALEEAAAAVEQHDRTGRSWVPDSLWGNITREAAGRIRALKGNSHGE